MIPFQASPSVAVFPLHIDQVRCGPSTWNLTQLGKAKILYIPVILALPGMCGALTTTHQHVIYIRSIHR